MNSQRGMKLFFHDWNVLIMMCAFELGQNLHLLTTIMSFHTLSSHAWQMALSSRELGIESRNTRTRMAGIFLQVLLVLKCVESTPTCIRNVHGRVPLRR